MSIILIIFLQISNPHYSHRFVLEALLKAGADPNVGKDILPLEKIVTMGNQYLVDLLLKAGADPNLGKHTVPIYQAVASGNYNIVELLLKAGADPKLGKHGLPIYKAVTDSYFNIAELLLKYGANINVINNESETPLTHWIKRNNLIVNTYLSFLVSYYLLHA